VAGHYFLKTSLSRSNLVSVLLTFLYKNTLQLDISIKNIIFTFLFVPSTFNQQESGPKDGQSLANHLYCESTHF